MNNQEQLNMSYLIFGAKMKKQIEIQYKYLYKGELAQRRFGAIQPIKWLTGEKGIHILGWDVEADNWRRFAVRNIEQITITDKDWVEQLEESITTLPH